MRRRGGCLDEEVGETAARELGDLVARAPALLSGRDVGALQPVAVGIREEVVARTDSDVDTALGSDGGIGAPNIDLARQCNGKSVCCPFRPRSCKGRPGLLARMGVMVRKVRRAR